MNWPEQQVKIVDQQLSPHVRPIRFRTLDNGVKQMLVVIPQLPAGETATALITFEVTKSWILAPDDPSSFVAPAKPPRETLKYLTPSPYIESRHPHIQSLAKEIVAPEQSAWEQVEAIFDWVRANIQYEFDVEIKSALDALRDGRGDCEELTSLFIALCRANSIPARAVWVPGHCYPEFYLQDGEGRGHWFPCQAAGASRDFGSMPEHRPILQKGDNFRLPGQRQPQRYVSETLQAQHAAADPRVQFIRQLLDN